MAITRQVITSLLRDGTDMLGIKNIAVKIVDESIVSGSLLTVESNHFCMLKSRGAVLNVYETGQYALTTPDKPLVGSIVQGFFGGSSPWVYEVIYINRSKLLVSNKGIATSAEMAEVAYQVDYYVHVDTKEAALDLITHMPFNGQIIDTRRARRLRRAGDRAGDQSGRSGHQARKHQRAHQRTAGGRQSPSDRFPQGLRHHAERPEGSYPAQGRSHARASLVAGAWTDADRGGALLSGLEDGREGSRLRSQCGGRNAVSDRRTRLSASIPLARKLD